MARRDECLGIVALFCWLTLLSNSIAQEQVHGTWQVEIVDGTHGRDSGSFSSLVIDHSGSQQRVPSQFKKIILQTQRSRIQQLFPDRCETLLQSLPGHSA